MRCCFNVFVYVVVICCVRRACSMFAVVPSLMVLLSYDFVRAYVPTVTTMSCYGCVPLLC